MKIKHFYWSWLGTLLARQVPCSFFFLRLKRILCSEPVESHPPFLPVKFSLEKDFWDVHLEGDGSQYIKDAICSNSKNLFDIGKFIDDIPSIASMLVF